MLKERVVTALVLTAVFFGVLFLGAAQRFSLFIVVVVLLASWEWARLSGFEKKISRGFYVVGVLIAIVLCAVGLNYFSLSSKTFANPVLLTALKKLLIVAAGFWAIALLFVQSYPSSAPLWRHKTILLLIGFFVLVPTCGALVFVRQQGVLWIILLIGTVAAADIGGYFAGRRFGKHKLAIEVSPGKTWEGFIGGLLANLILAALIGFFAHQNFLILSAIMLPTSLVSVLGDLFESMIKRQAGVKDSGTLLPGHGGILDRVDGITAAAPVFALALLATGLVSVGV